MSSVLVLVVQRWELTEHSGIRIYNWENTLVSEDL